MRERCRCFRKLDYCGGETALHRFFGVISKVGSIRPSGEQINRENTKSERKKAIVGEGDAKGGMCEVILSSSKIPDKRSLGLFPLRPRSCLMGVTKGTLTLIMKGGDSPQKMKGWIIGPEISDGLCHEVESAAAFGRDSASAATSWLALDDGLRGVNINL